MCVYIYTYIITYVLSLERERERGTERFLALFESSVFSSHLVQELAAELPGFFDEALCWGSALVLGRLLKAEYTNRLQYPLQGFKITIPDRKPSPKPQNLLKPHRAVRICAGFTRRHMVAPLPVVWFTALVRFSLLPVRKHLADHNIYTPRPPMVDA